MSTTSGDALYDRQLRLWGCGGQRALEAAHVCLCGASALGSEALKSLVLAGVGAITIVDGGAVAPEDVGCDFFLEESSVGASRAAETVRLLLELNPNVRGRAVPEAPKHVLAERPDFFDEFSCVLATGLSERETVELADRLWDANVPLVACRSVGFVASLRVQVREHVVVEAHPDDRRPDLRLSAPFPQLREFVDALPTATKHAPWPAIALAAKREWSETETPTTRAHKDEIKRLARRLWSDDDGEEENVREAVRAINWCFAPTETPARVAELFEDDACARLHRGSSPFWIACAAVGEFERETGALPLRGALPDMTASTALYVALQNAYRAKAAADAESVYERARRLANECGAEAPNEADVRAVCKNAAELRCVRGARLSGEYAPSPSFAANVRLEDEPTGAHYVALRAAERFRAEQCRAPGERDPYEDFAKLKAYAAKLLTEWSCAPFSVDDACREMCRYGGAELHGVSALMGGCAAQEIVKLVTKQYVPVDDTFVYEAMTGNSATFSF